VSNLCIHVLNLRIHVLNLRIDVFELQVGVVVSFINLHYDFVVLLGVHQLEFVNRFL